MKVCENLGCYDCFSLIFNNFATTKSKLDMSVNLLTDKEKEILKKRHLGSKNKPLYTSKEGSDLSGIKMSRKIQG